MGGGDLNMKKHFHPLTMENLERVWKAEEKKRKEEERIQQLQQELEEERRREELQQQAVNSGIIKKKTEKLDWMYTGQQRDNTEEFLLGKRIESKDLADDNKSTNIPEKVSEDRGYNPKASDVLMKVKEDPLFLIRKREEQSRKELAMNPLKVQQMKAMLEKQLQNNKKNKKKKKKKNKQYSSDDDDESNGLKHAKSSRYSDERIRQVRGDGRHGGNRTREKEHRYHNDSDKRHRDERQQYDDRKRDRSPISRERNRNRRRHSFSSDDETRPRRENERARRDSLPDEIDRRKDRQRRHKEDDDSDKKRRERRKERIRSDNEDNDNRKSNRDGQRRQRRRRSSSSEDEEMERKRQEMIQNAKTRNAQREESMKMLKIDRLKEAAEKASRKEKADFIQDMTLDSLSNETSTVEDRIKRGIFSKQRTKASLDKFLKR